ncbi:MAG: hypothetical protein NTY01_10025, partial [Verrucomicrobia bacterium]|nr:hypothetical protein [Verrucomicrobiota bacterium]
MRQADPRPFRIVKRHCLRTRVITEFKAPVSVEIQLLANSCLRLLRSASPDCKGHPESRHNGQ